MGCDLPLGSKTGPRPLKGNDPVVGVPIVPPDRGTQSSFNVPGGLGGGLHKLEVHIGAQNRALFPFRKGGAAGLPNAPEMPPPTHPPGMLEEHWVPALGAKQPICFPPHACIAP